MVSRSALLDPHFCLSELLLSGCEARVQARFVEACTDATGQKLLRNPPAASRLAAAVTTALMASRSPPLAELLAQGDRLQILARAYLYACMPPPAALPWLAAAQLQLRRLRLAAALSAAASIVGDVLAVESPSPSPRPFKRQRVHEGGAALTAADVNVRRYDSVTLLICGEPLYVNGMLMESSSPLLADLLSGVAAPPGAPAAPPVVTLPTPADVYPAALHTLCCAAVEHTYTGNVQRFLLTDSYSSLLPLWCVAQHLQMNALQAFCITRLEPALRADSALLLAAAGVAMRHRCDALLQRVASATIAASSDPVECDATVRAVLQAAAGGAEGAALEAVCDALADAMAAVLREGLLSAQQG
jgi:hypothetical protein